MYNVHEFTNQRGACIKEVFWPPFEPKTENGFSPILLIGLLEECLRCNILALILLLPLLW